MVFNRDLILSQLHVCLQTIFIAPLDSKPNIVDKKAQLSPNKADVDRKIFTLDFDTTRKFRWHRLDRWLNQLCFSRGLNFKDIFIINFVFYLKLIVFVLQFDDLSQDLCLIIFLFMLSFFQGNSFFNISFTMIKFSWLSLFNPSTFLSNWNFSKDTSTILVL